MTPELGDGTAHILLLPASAVQFDCDGVLVDSDDSVIEAWSRWARHYDLPVHDVLEVVHGQRAADTVRRFIPAEQFSAALRRINDYELEDAGRVRPIPGADRLLRSMPPGAWAVVTSGTTPLATARLAAAGLPVPPVLVSADDVEQGKPAPDPYLAGAARLGLNPSATVVVEDSASGIQAARAAGAGHVVGIGERALPSHPDITVPDLTRLAWDGQGLRVERSAWP